MCLAIPGQLVRILPEANDRGIVDLEGVQREVSLSLVSSAAAVASDAVTPHDVRDAQVGDWVLVHVGFVLSVIDEEEAQETLRLLREMDGVLEDELQLASADATTSAAAGASTSARTNTRANTGTTAS